MGKTRPIRTQTSLSARIVRWNTIKIGMTSGPSTTTDCSENLSALTSLDGV
jgi:hypothetical protein